VAIYTELVRYLDDKCDELASDRAAEPPADVADLPLERLITQVLATRKAALASIRDRPLRRFGDCGTEPPDAPTPR